MRPGAVAELPVHEAHESEGARAALAPEVAAVHDEQAAEQCDHGREGGRQENRHQAGRADPRRSLTMTFTGLLTGSARTRRRPRRCRRAHTKRRQPTWHEHVDDGLTRAPRIVGQESRDDRARGHDRHEQSSRAAPDIRADGAGQGSNRPLRSPRPPRGQANEEEQDVPIAATSETAPSPTRGPPGPSRPPEQSSRGFGQSPRSSDDEADRHQEYGGGQRRC